MFSLLTPLNDRLYQMAECFQEYVAAQVDRVQVELHRSGFSLDVPVDPMDVDLENRYALPRPSKSTTVTVVVGRTVNSLAAMYFYLLSDVWDAAVDLLQNAFMHHQYFSNKLEDAFTTELDRAIGRWRPSELLAKFCDDMLLGKEKMTDDTLYVSDDAVVVFLLPFLLQLLLLTWTHHCWLSMHVQATLSKIIKFFTLLNDKDLFCESYRRLLALRLLDDRFNEELEAHAVGLLKVGRPGAGWSIDRRGSQRIDLFASLTAVKITLQREYGGEYSEKLEGMFSDVASSKHTTTQFLERLSACSGPNWSSHGCEIHVSVGRS